MKEIRAYIQPRKLASLTTALMEIPDFPGMTVMDCEGFGREQFTQQIYSPFRPKKRLEIFAPDDMVEVIFNTILTVAHSGHAGDGWVHVCDVQQSARISSGERYDD